MNRLPKSLIPSGILILTLLLLTFFLTSCGEDDPVLPEVTNHAPVTPVINAGAGAPADAAVDVALSVQLHWTCTDPDDDPLTYTVHFGTATTPAVVSQDQATASYTPAGLTNSTTYYWQITAADDDAKSTESPVWSFTTVAATIETVSAPAIPSGAAAATTAEVPSYDTSGAISSEGHDVEYRFDWGDGTMSAWVTIGTRTHSWAAAGTYEVKAQARCAADTDVESAWSAALTVTVTAVAETVSEPNIPTGQISGAPGDVLAYAVTGAGSSDGHAIEYRFDWDDGTMSNWDASGTTTHGWSTAGNYNVKGQARCATHNEVESVWSRPRVVTIAVDAETVSTPGAPTGPATGETDVALTYSATGSVSSDGHALEYRFDWGDGTMSAWSTGNAIAYTWTAAGSYEVKAQARCAVDTAIESAWSSALALTVTAPVTESVSMPTKPSGSVEAAIGESNTYLTSGATSSEGHPVEYRIDWGDGTFSDWGTSGSAAHAWTSSGYYQLRAQARCQDHPAVESIWSPALQIAIGITETVYPPTTPTGPEILEVGESGFYRTSGAISNLGHNLEYRCDWGNGTISDWADVTGIRYTWDTAGSYEVATQARCVEHPDVESVWSYVSLTVTVLDAETVSTPDAPVGPTTSIIQDQVTYDFTGAVSTWGHALEYRINWGDGVTTGWMVNDFGVYYFYTAGSYDILIQARCQDHPTVESAWSAATTLVASPPAEVVGTAYIGAWPHTGGIDELREFSFSSGYSNLGHPTEMQIDWGDGTISDWEPRIGLHLVRDHAWTAVGTYQVTARARCIEHPEYISDWMTAVPVEIFATETVSAPLYPTAREATYDVGAYLQLSTGGAESNMGHVVEYQLDLGDGTFGEWYPGGYTNPLATDVEGDFPFRFHARCAAHPDIVSEWGATVLIHIVALETIDGRPTLTGPATATVGVPAVFTVADVVSSFGHELEYQLYDSYAPSVPGVGQGWTTADNLSITWDSPNQRYIQVNARCKLHPEVEGLKPLNHDITITD